jgi:hypothetical protein
MKLRPFARQHVADLSPRWRCYHMPMPWAVLGPISLIVPFSVVVGASTLLLPDPYRYTIAALLGGGSWLLGLWGARRYFVPGPNCACRRCVGVVSFLARLSSWRGRVPVDEELAAMFGTYGRRMARHRDVFVPATGTMPGADDETARRLAKVPDPRYVIVAEPDPGLSTSLRLRTSLQVSDDGRSSAEMLSAVASNAAPWVVDQHQADAIATARAHSDGIPGISSLDILGPFDIGTAETVAALSVTMPAAEAISIARAVRAPRAVTGER